MSQADVLLEQLSVTIPEVNVKDLNIETLMFFDCFNWAEQFSNDLKLFTLISVLHKEAAKRQRALQDELDVIESILYEENYKRMRDEDGKTAALNFAKSLSIKDQRYQDQLTKVRAIQAKVQLLESLVDALTKKGIVLNVLAARDRAELQSGLKV